MSLPMPTSDSQDRDESQHETQRGAKPIFHSVAAPDGAGTERAHVIAILTGLFILAIVVSQFGRPSRAREAEFLRSAAKVERLGKFAPSDSAVGDAPGNLASVNPRIELARIGLTPTALTSTASGRSGLTRAEDAKELTPEVYASRRYGVEWQYPRTYVLRKGTNANVDLYGHPATESALTSGGGVALATVIIPARVFPATDFRMAALTARVNAKVSEDDCAKFRRASSDTGDTVALSSAPETVGTIDFTEADVDAADGGNLAVGDSAAERFYHVYENEACY